jgi:hypothetical protein
MEERELILQPPPALGAMNSQAAADAAAGFIDTGIWGFFESVPRSRAINAG